MTLHATIDDRLDTVRAHYRKDAVAKALYDHLAASVSFKVETTVESLERGAGIEHSAVVAFVKTVAGWGLGCFIVGRLGHKSRIKWFVNPIHLARRARGDDVGSALSAVDDDAVGAEGGPHDELSEPAAPSQLVEHRFRLRPGVDITLRLPGDLTGSEAERVSTLVRALPIG
jgi:hypothetical protein